MHKAIEYLLEGIRVLELRITYAEKERDEALSKVAMNEDVIDRCRRDVEQYTRAAENLNTLKVFNMQSDEAVDG